MAAGGAVTDWISLWVPTRAVPRDVVEVVGIGAKRSGRTLPPHVTI
jgi:hypothetical protein